MCLVVDGGAGRMETPHAPTPNDTAWMISFSFVKKTSVTIFFFSQITTEKKTCDKLISSGLRLKPMSEVHEKFLCCLLWGSLHKITTKVADITSEVTHRCDTTTVLTIVLCSLVPHRRQRCCVHHAVGRLSWYHVVTPPYM